jgi:NADH:ubiquinone oxidoreductase subunit F (NADH-binding)
VPLDFKSLADAGSMLGSSGVVVLNDTVDMKWAVRQQLRFFEDESCGQCAPCRIGTYYLRESVDRQFGVKAGQGVDAGEARDPQPAPDASGHLKHAADVAWQMNEGSICGLGQAAPLPLTTAMQHFPEDFAS